MPKKQNLTEAQRGQIVLLHSQGVNNSKIAKQMNCSRCAVINTIKKFSESGTYGHKPGDGRKRKTSVQTDRIIHRMSLKNRHKNVSDTQNELERKHNVKISVRTVRRRLVQENLHGRKPRRKPLLTQEQIKKRFSWAKKYENWREEDWVKVIWSDESNIELFGQPGAQYVRRRPGEAFNIKCTIPTVKHGGGSIMIWGCMSARGVGEVKICEGRMNTQKYLEVLEEALEPSILTLFEEDDEEYRFQQDNAPCLKSKVAMEWFTENQIKLFEWPPQSPDLSPIENLWTYLKKQIRKCKPN